MHEEGCFILPNPWEVGSAASSKVRGLVVCPRLELALLNVHVVVTWSVGESSGFAALPVAVFCQYVADDAIAIANKPLYLN